ncbi:transporter substrate-binding domain-containing protein [Labrenzia sp. CE80]|uniref:transporter substrate-binding domain-containing protein n=1 Tax=Labrenzia sp. CE80 TaxID=1788986 RepID=UPI00129ABE8C|nr:transporter substrate-binding domain-containing protein [Labrenzia sp. CE80]
MKFDILKGAALGLGLTLATFGAAQADMLEDIKSSGEMTFGTEMHYAPFDLLVNGEYEGLCKDLMDEVTKDLGVSPVYNDLPWTSVLPGLEAGKFQMVNAPVTITAERLERYAFTLPIADASVGLLKRAGDDRISSPEDIKGLVVGSQKGSAQLEQLKVFGEEVGGVDTREYSSVDEAYADLAAGRLDAVAGSFPLLGYVASQRPEVFETVTPVFGKKKYFAWVAVKSDETKSLIEEVNKIILKMQDDGRMAKLHEKWLGTAVELPREMPAMN